MRILIAACGRIRKGPQQQLIDEYLKRLDWTVTIREIESRKQGNQKIIQQDEGNQLLDAIPDGARVVVLDERGRDMSSRDFAAKMTLWQDDGISDTVFIIGGADGLIADVRKRADLLMCFGKQTWPHQLVRVMLCEQLYRARQIMAGHPYHRD